MNSESNGVDWTWKCYKYEEKFISKGCMTGPINIWTMSVGSRNDTQLRVDFESADAYKSSQNIHITHTTK